MNTTLWIIQGLLAAMFLMAGIMKTFMPKDKLAKMTWTVNASVAKIKFVGISELLIALGLVLPQLTGILPILTPVAACALVVIMILAAVEHYNSNEMKAIGMNMFILLLAAFVAYGRFTTM